ncbi:unnamed protein product [Heterotrigona itama]|uniref:C2H2-type domain-containing protein n=1 Tax=Heterotrigona itama TaxID=395501 RepID=A0A6V7H055_9HYME|nr:unnamed protein product [Heterotrigona itama]
MATLDMQQNILNQVAESEQQLQEEVQLTELLPVKQSQIRENEIFKHMDTHTDATDALKILQSFTITDDCYNDGEHELRSRNLSPCSKIGQTDEEQQENGRQWREDKKKGRNSIRRLENESKAQKKMYKYVNKQSMIDRVVKSTKKRTIIYTVENTKHEGNGDGWMGNHKFEENEFFDDKEGNCMSKNDEQVESTIYFDPDKNHLHDDIYLIHRELVNEGQSRKISHSSNAETIYENEDYAKTIDGALLDRIASRTLIEKNVDEIGKRFDAIATDISNSKLIRENSAEEPKLNFRITTMSYLVENNHSKNNNSTVRIEENSTSSLFGPNTISSSSSLLSSASSSCSSSSPSSSLSLPPYSKENDMCGGEDENTTIHGLNPSMKTKQENQQKKYCCVVCEARFKGSGGLRNHYKIVHGAGPIFKCDECGKEFPLKERLKLHVRTHTGFKPYKCPECDKSFARGGQLVQHRRTHSQVKPYHCGLCSGTFTCAANLALHVKRHNGQKDHKCEICGRAFVRRDALKKHLECLHRDVKSFLCVICNKTFKGHLPQHMRTHARDRPHGCATCGQRFAQKSQLTVHQRTHSGQRPFRCLVCWQAFAHSTALKLHTRRHTGERPFKCAECNAGFTQLPHWKKHMKCIHGRNEPYACKKCTSFFRIKNDLECHEKTCHPESEAEHDAPSARTTKIITNATIMPTSISMTLQQTTASSLLSSETVNDKFSPSPSKYKIMTVERMRLLLAVLLKRISKQERLDELGFGKRLIDEVLYDSLISAGKDPVTSNGLNELETLTKNLEIFLKWTVPKEHWEHFRKLNKTPEDILETLTAT